MYSFRAAILPSFILVLMGSIDCITTVIGVLYFGAAEMNPFMTGIVSSSILAFTIVKVAATLCIASTYILAKRTLNRTTDKSTRSFRLGNVFIKVAYAGLVLFFMIVVTNNFIVLLS